MLSDPSSENVLEKVVLGLTLRAIMKEPDEDWDSKVFPQFPCD